MRVGIGYDVHRFDGRGPLRLGGITVPCARRLAGHSDADVLLHAVADALLGAIGAPDLGEQFPSDDPRYRRADSRRFVEAAYAAARRQGWVLGNLDATIIADIPRLTAAKARMGRAISRLLEVPAGCVSVKAKTTEGFPPGGRGIAAQAVVLLKSADGRGPARRPQRPLDSGPGLPRQARDSFDSRDPERSRRLAGGAPRRPVQWLRRPPSRRHRVMAR
jgi:2-C-methyl-D-erythritol 2,4-cyclodiphosphate synthase